ncbi:MAG: PaaI family thioesterase [Chromatiales bacterium]|nr:MAG: PaaI family thioesterase [Chromatiales bacterium]
MLPDANRCFVCGPANPIGLQLHFQIDGEDVCRTEFTPGPDHGGYAQLTHGGIVYSVLDDVMANWLYLKGMRAHTARCEIRYRQPLSIGTRVLLEGRLVRQKGKVAFLQGKMRKADDGTLVAEAEASFMIVAG